MEHFLPYEIGNASSVSCPLHRSNGVLNDDCRFSTMMYDHKNILWYGTVMNGIIRWDGTGIDTLTVSNSALADN